MSLRTWSEGATYLSYHTKGGKRIMIDIIFKENRVREKLIICDWNLEEPKNVIFCVKIRKI